MGSVSDVLPSKWFGDSLALAVYVAYSARPFKLRDSFGILENGRSTVIVWDGGYVKVLFGAIGTNVGRGSCMVS